MSPPRADMYAIVRLVVLGADSKLGLTMVRMIFVVIFFKLLTSGDLDLDILNWKSVHRLLRK